MPSDTALDAIQVAVFSALSGDATLAGKAKVYDFVPKGAAFPYVKVGEDHELNASTFGKNGRDVRVTLHIWDRMAATGGGTLGWKIADSILSDCIRLLDFPATPLTITGWPTTPISLYEDATKLGDPDPLVRHLVVFFRFLVEQ